jgi:RNA polymerase sigma-70 factor (ECF subfamily)
VGALGADDEAAPVRAPRRGAPAVAARDEARVERLRRGGQRISGRYRIMMDFDAVVRAHHPHVLRRAHQIVRHDQDVEDVAQIVWIRVARSYGAFRGDAAVSSWLYRITTNCAISFLRHGQRRTAGQHMPLDVVTTLPDRGPQPDAQATARDLRRRCRRAILALPASHGQVLRVMALGGRSLREASAALHLPDGTVKSRLNRARASLRDNSGSMGASPDLQRLPSRIHGPRRLLSELRRLRAKTDRAAAHRAATPEERTLACARRGCDRSARLRGGGRTARLSGLARPPAREKTSRPAPAASGRPHCTVIALENALHCQVCARRWWVSLKNPDNDSRNSAYEPRIGHTSLRGSGMRPWAECQTRDRSPLFQQ